LYQHHPWSLNIPFSTTQHLSGEAEMVVKVPLIVQVHKHYFSAGVRRCLFVIDGMSSRGLLR
jgi:hypothetical protein